MVNGKVSDLLHFRDSLFFDNDLSFVLICGGACTDWIFTLEPEDHGKILDWFEGKYDSLGFDRETLGNVLRANGELPVHPYGLELRDYMLENFHNVPLKVQHGSQGLNAAIQAAAFGFNVSYGHSISKDNLETLRKKSPASLELMKGIDYEEGNHEPSVTVNIRTNMGNGTTANVYLSDARERNYNAEGVLKHLDDAEERIEKARKQSSGVAILVADLQVMGHSVERDKFSEYLSKMDELLGNISKHTGEEIRMVVDCGGLNAYSDEEIRELFKNIYSHADVLGCNEFEYQSMKKALDREKMCGKTEPSCFVTENGIVNLWIHTRDKQTYFSRRKKKPEKKEIEKIAKALLFSNLTAGLSIEQKDPVTLEDLKGKIDMVKSGKYAFR